MPRDLKKLWHRTQGRLRRGAAAADLTKREREIQEAIEAKEETRFQILRKRVSDNKKRLRQERANSFNQRLLEWRDLLKSKTSADQNLVQTHEKTDDGEGEAMWIDAPV